VDLDECVLLEAVDSSTTQDMDAYSPFPHIPQRHNSCYEGASGVL